MKTKPLHFGPILFSWLLSAPCFSSQAGLMDHWTTNQVSTNHFGLTYVVYGNGRYVAYGPYSDYGSLMSSEDGVNWVLRNDGGGASGSGLSYSVALSYAGGKYFALGGFGVSAVSSDGISWNTFSFPIAKGV